MLLYHIFLAGIGHLAVVEKLQMRRTPRLTEIGEKDNLRLCYSAPLDDRQRLPRLIWAHLARKLLPGPPGMNVGMKNGSNP